MTTSPSASRVASRAMTSMEVDAGVVPYSYKKKQERLLGNTRDTMLYKAEQAIEKATEKHEGDKKELVTLKKEYEEYLKEEEKGTKDMEVLENKIQGLELELEGLRTEILSLDAQLSPISIRREALENQVKELEENISFNEKYIPRIQNALDDLDWKTLIQEDLVDRSEMEDYELLESEVNDLETD